MVKGENCKWKEQQTHSPLESEWQLPDQCKTTYPQPVFPLLHTITSPFNNILLDHNYVMPGSLTVPGYIVSIPIRPSSMTSMLPYRHTFVPLTEGEKSLSNPKVEQPLMNRPIKKTASKSKAKNRPSKKENVHCDAANAQSGAKTKRTPKKRKEEIKTKPITDYFPSQRSKRKTSVVIMKEKLKEFEEMITSGSEDGFEVHDFFDKGRGVIANKNVNKGDFVLEYRGELITMEEAKRREIFYANNETIGCYMYYFSYRNKQYCVDATKETTRLGRLVNHSKKGNLKTKTFLIDDTPHLILVADRDILAGEELLYDYGDRSKRSLQYYPWLAT